MTMGHWNMMVMGRGLIAPGAAESAGTVFNASDPTRADALTPDVRRPMGPMVDLYYIWTNRPIFDISTIQAPTLVIRGDSDIFADPGLIGKLTGTAQKKEVVIQDATHWVLYEQHRDRLLDETSRFLSEQE
jgi:pimeloyl-ACP methyl ester carboxylesterase